MTDENKLVEPKPDPDPDPDPYQHQLISAEMWLEEYWDYRPIILGYEKEEREIIFSLKMSNPDLSDFSVVPINDMGLNFEQWSEIWIRVADRIGCEWLEAEVAVNKERKRIASEWGRAMMIQAMNDKMNNLEDK